MSEAIIFDVSLAPLSWDDLIFLEEGARSFRYARDLCAKFMVTAAGEPLEPAAARRILGALPEDQVKPTVAKALEAIKEARANAVNPTNGA